MPRRDIIVIGTSAGGTQALKSLLSALPAHLPASLFIVLHMPADKRSFLPEVLAPKSRLPVKPAQDGITFENNTVYVSVPDHHMTLYNGEIRLIYGPKENRHRPAVDPLFRSAAYWHGPRVIGVILTGALDDGAAGIRAVKERGGIAVVQDPEDAEYPSMPLNALKNIRPKFGVDFMLPLDKIPAKLQEIAVRQAPDALQYPVSDLLAAEYSIQNNSMKNSDQNERVGAPSEFSCPECGGVLNEITESNEFRFRCRVGHAFSKDSMLEEQTQAIERALWSALKTLEENQALTERIIRQSNSAGQQWLAERFEEKLQETQNRAASIRAVLAHGGDSLPAPSSKKPSRRAVPRRKQKKTVAFRKMNGPTEK